MHKAKLALSANKLSPRVVSHALSSGVVLPVRAVAAFKIIFAGNRFMN
jgi:hypothetical protein